MNEPARHRRRRRRSRRRVGRRGRPSWRRRRAQRHRPTREPREERDRRRRRPQRLLSGPGGRPGGLEAGHAGSQGERAADERRRERGAAAPRRGGASAPAARSTPGEPSCAPLLVSGPRQSSRPDPLGRRGAARRARPAPVINPSRTTGRLCGLRSRARFPVRKAISNPPSALQPADQDPARPVPLTAERGRRPRSVRSPCASSGSVTADLRGRHGGEQRAPRRGRRPGCLFTIRSPPTAIRSKPSSSWPGERPAPATTAGQGDVARHHRAARESACRHRTNRSS